MGARIFLEIYKSLEDMVYIQSIIDFIEIIFEPISQDKMSFEDVAHILSKRSSAKSREIAEMIFKKTSK